MGYPTHQPQKEEDAKMRKLMAIPLAIVASFWFSVMPASADINGYMNQDEYNWIHTSYPNQDTRAEVQDHCNCTGVKIWDGVRGDYDAIGMRYATPSGADAYVYFVIRDGYRYAYAKDWCNDTGCHEGDV